MYWIDLGLSMLDNIFNISGTQNKTYGVYDVDTGTKKALGSDKLSNMSTYYMCVDILSSTLGLIPLDVVRDGRVDKEHRLYYQLRHKMSDLINNQVLMSTIEFQRNTFGNSFVDIRGASFDLIPIEIVDDWDWKGRGDTLRYHLNWPIAYDVDKRFSKKQAEWVNAKDVLHFKGLSTNGVMGIPKVTAAVKHLTTMSKASDTVINFYENRAMSPMALESKLDSVNAIKAFQDGVTGFEAKYAGAKNAGKAIVLPANTKLTPLQLQFAESELINTMKFSRDEICRMFKLPAFLYNNTDTVQMDIEQQSKNFIMFTVAPILSIYASEFKDKLLSKREVLKGIDVKYDTSVLVESDLASLAQSYSRFIQSGVASPNEAAKRLGFEPLDDPIGDQKFVQQQLIALGYYNDILLGKNPQTNNNNNEGNKNTE